MKTQNNLTLALIPMLVVLLLVLLINQLLLPIVSDQLFSLMLSLLIVFSVVFFVFFYQKGARERFPAAYNVAVLGFPQSGKTTLITYTFNEVFERRIKSLNLRPEGNSTVEAINKNIRSLESGYALTETTDDEIRAYRATLELKRSFFQTIYYQIQLGDFPGEDSQKFALEYGDWIHGTPFFQWATSAHAFIFVIDTAPFLDADQESKREESSRIESAFRAAWQRLVNSSREPIALMRDKPIVLAFTKIDLFFNEESKKILDENERIERKRVPKTVNLNSDTNTEELKIVDHIKRELLEEFESLVRYLDGETSRFNVVFTSSFTKIDDKRLGIAELLDGIVPR